MPKAVFTLPLVTSYNAKSLHSYFPCNQGLLSQQDFLPTQNRLLLPLFPHQQLNKLAGCSEWMLAACGCDGHVVWQELDFQNNTCFKDVITPAVISAQNSQLGL